MSTSRRPEYNRGLCRRGGEGRAAPGRGRLWLSFIHSPTALSIFERYGFKPYTGSCIGQLIALRQGEDTHVHPVFHICIQRHRDRPSDAVSPDRGAAHVAHGRARLLSIRVIQGFIYWGGGSRRFIYAPSKLDPDAPTWMANKFQTAMPGALFGTDHLISFMLHHFWLLYAGVILFSAAELIVGAMLMAGALTRLAALVSMGFSVLLMAMFGWQGATCIDEWTMAACNLAMGATLLLAGSGAGSIDNVLLRRNPALAENTWFRWMAGSLPLPLKDNRLPQPGARRARLRAGLRCRDLQLLSRLGAHAVPRRTGQPDQASSDAQRRETAAGRRRPLPRLSRCRHAGGARCMLSQPICWTPTSSRSRTGTPPRCRHCQRRHFANDYAYNKFAPGPFGIRAPMGAAATVTLPASGATPKRDSFA